MTIKLKSVPHVEGELSLREIQLESLAILKAIDKICASEGLRYWLMFGSLIGVVRHKGFIPWDDDLDIAMPRGDYEKFMTYFSAHEEELKPLVALEPKVGENQPFLITRVSNSGFKMLGEYGEYLDNLGTFVDIYPLDGLGDDIECSVAHKTAAYKLIVNYLRACNYDCSNTGNGALKKLAKTACSMLLGEPDKYQKKLNALCLERGFDDSTYVSNISWTVSADESIYERRWFETTERMPFEDMTVPVPGGYDSLLRCDYGDYMQLPPENERVGHHFYSITKRNGAEDVSVPK